MFPTTVGNLGGVLGEGGLVHLRDKVCIFVKVTFPMVPLGEWGL